MPVGAVLVVDHYCPVRDLVAVSLRTEGYEVETVRDAAEALAEVRRIRPDLVILDPQMPLMDGWSFAREVRDGGNVPRLLILTAEPNARSRSTRVHADGYLGKPFDLDTLLREVGRLCGPPALCHVA
jgi:DNA-binding response OmpR family regulator